MKRGEGYLIILCMYKIILTRAAARNHNIRFDYVRFTGNFYRIPFLKKLGKICSGFSGNQQLRSRFVFKDSAVIMLNFQKLPKYGLMCVCGSFWKISRK